MEFNNQPIVTAGLLIRKPAAEVFEAFVDPEIITKFWFSRSTGRLVAGQRVVWHWDIYNVAAQVQVMEIEQHRKILLDWWSGTETPTSVEWTFDARTADSTYVTINNTGFSGDGDTVVSAALDAKGGFTLVLAAAKAYLEYGIQLRVVEDSA